MRFFSSRPAIVCLLTILFLLPFANKAFHVDDPLFIWAAQQIQKHPLDPYGFTVNWNDVPEPMYQVTKNPPLVSYYIAAVAWVTGYGEIPLHLAFFLPACLFTAGTFVLASRFVERPVWAALIALISPAFWVSATSVMCDVWMTALLVWAVIWWLRGVEGNRWQAYLVSGCLLGAAALCKYFAASMLAVFLVHALARKAKPVCALAFVIPVGALAGWEVWTKHLYGAGMISEAMRWSGEARSVYHSDRAMQAIVASIYVGGCVLPIGFLALGAHRLRVLGALLAGGGALLGLAAVFAVYEPRAPYTADLTPLPVWSHALVFLFVAVSAFAFAVRAGVRTDMLLLSWAVLAFIFVAALNWVVNARVILPLVPPLAILCQMALERDSSRVWTRRRYALCLVPAGLLGLAVNVGDYQLADGARTVVPALRKGSKGHLEQVGFVSHWGLQYYLQLEGSKPLEVGTASLPKWVVQPTQGASSFSVVGDSRLTPIARLDPPRWPLASTLGDNEFFYATAGRVLPFRFGVGHQQDFLVFQRR